MNRSSKGEGGPRLGFSPSVFDARLCDTPEGLADRTGERGAELYARRVAEFVGPEKR